MSNQADCYVVQSLTCDVGLSVTTVRNVCLPSGMLSIAGRGNQVTLELDSHADTCCVGMNALIIHDYDRPVSVYGYNKALGRPSELYLLLLFTDVP